MQYGQIVFLLFVALLIYYAVLIVLDIQKAKAAQAAELDNHNEEEIDISDEAQSFKPKRVSRDETRQQDTSESEKAPENEKSNEATDDGQEQQPESEKPFHRPGYREAIMTDGILVEDLFAEVEKLAETGTCDLGTLIFTCENARLS
ncbi:hypothetical protein [Bacteroides faecalis]|uniref:Uncharacterized protein n=1 Tax=Bacteroides faecalis TaxID=2447885 RepID=A0A401LQA1_9BACE|nr:hypothetical protein [Bacteroides faecalis]GCB33653.1 hypothetical protein KGMB02408_05980 [Bacteroides faecalis]